MDFTALELALRNRQLLQVKCFLKIQIETFRFVLSEELNNSLPSEQIATLEKFFLHDWQNVVNKIFSVATMQMSGDYSAKIFATLLFRSLIHSNNQLILIVSSILDENSNDVFIRSVSPLSITSSTTNINQLIVVKEKILSILMKQITSIRDNLSKIQGSELTSTSSTDLKLSGSDQDESIELDIDNFLNIDNSDKISISNGKFQQLFENCLSQDCIPLFSWMVKKYSESLPVEKQLNTKNQLQWQNIVERIANFVTKKIRSSDDINIEMIKSYLVQTGIPDLDLLFALFIQTSDSIIRHKLLQMFAKIFNNSETNIINHNDQLSMENFGEYFQILSIIDMYIYIFRTKLLHDEQMELSIEWLLENRSERILAKSFLLPVLDEIADNPNSFTEWEELTGHFYNHDYFDLFRKNIFIRENFDNFIKPETLWQYLIDNNKSNCILNWIQNYTKTLPHCSEIRPINLETCQQMMEYLSNQSPLMLRYETFGALISNPYFFNQHDFQSLIGTICAFEDFLTLIGQTGIVNQEKGYIILERLLNKVIKLLPLVEYCTDNRLFEFLFLLYNRYKIDFDVLVSTNYQFNKSDTFLILKFLSGLCSINDEILEDNVFEKSFFIHRFLNGNDENHYSFQDNIIYMLQTMANQTSNLDLIIFILSFAHTETFDDFSRILKQLHNNDAEQLVKIFLNKLNSKFPLIYRVFNDNIVNCDMIEYNLSSLPSNSLSMDDDCFCNIGQPSYYNIYTFLQEAIPFVNISKVFQWQINKLKNQQSNAAVIAPEKDQTEDNNELPHFFQKKLTVYGLKSNLTASYYLKNFRLIQAFIAYNIIPSEDSKHIGGSRELRSNLLNEKLAIKAIKKSAIIAYSSTKDDSVITSCLLFQSLIKSCLSQTVNSKSTVNESLRKNINNECEKFCLHLALGRLIIEYASDFLDLQNVQQQQSVLASLLRRSHFHSDPACSQKLLDLSTIAIERKYSSNVSSSQTKLSSSEQKKFLTDVKLFSLFFDSLDNETESNPFSKSIINYSMIECFEWKPLFMFANYYSLKKPMNFFNKCTREDNWLMLTIFIQLYEIPKEEVQLLLSNATFNNQCIGEHLAKAFQSSRYVNVSNLSETDSRILKSKQLPNTSRNDLYSKLFKEKHPLYSTTTSTPIQNTPIQIESHFPDSKNLTFSPNNSNSTDSPETQSLLSISMFSSRITDENISNICVVLPQKLSYNTASKDFLQLVLDIYQNCTLYSHRIGDSSFSIEASFQLSLLYASVSLSNPILTFLACSVRRIQTKKIDIGKSFDETFNTLDKKNLSTIKLNDSINLGRLKYLSLACWILARVDPRLKQSYIDWYYQNNLVEQNDNSLVDCFTNWSPERLLQLINVLTSTDAKSFQVIWHGFKMFEINIPILNVLLKFFINFLIMKDYFQTDDLLHFQSLLIKYNEEEFIQSNKLFFQDESNDFLQEAEWSITEFYTRNWIEKCSLIIITNSLLIVKQFELNILLSHYNFVRIQDNFSIDIHRVPDLRKIYLFSQCLNKVPDYTLPIAELLLVERTYGDAEPHYGEVFSKLIFSLQEAGHFDVARNIINLLTDTNTNDFIINEWMLKAKQAELDNDVISSNIDISFLENCWLQVSKLDPTMHSAFKVMERFVQQLNSNQILIKCFVLLKCLMAIESILKDYSENEKDLNLSPNIDDNSTICSSTISNNSDLIQDYFNFEVSLWKSVLECEFSIQTALQNSKTDNDSNTESYLECKNSNFNLTWQHIWKEIVSYFNSSIILKTILIKLNERHPYLYKNVENQRKKQIILLEVFKHEALNTVIQNLLDYFCYVKAKEVSKLFNYVHEDFEIIEACEQTARDILKDISDSPISVQLKKKNKLNLVSNISSCNFNLAQRKIISMLETFTNFATIGQKYCEYILLQYKIACYLGKTYSELKDSELNSVELFEMLISANQTESNELLVDDIQSEDGLTINDSVSFSTNHISLIDRYMETIMCAKEFIRVVGRVDEKLNDEEKIVNLLAQFVFQNVQQIVERQFGNDGADRIYGQNLMEIELDRTELQFYSARFSILIRLLRDPCLLGYKLLELAKKSKSTFESTFTEFWDETEAQFIIAKRKHYVQMVELYIRAHECFQCDVGGIALVLRKTRFLITTELKPARYFHLILRLLTGIGRYSEMTYCFDLFRECDRFELILSKRVQRTPQLRIALLNYLKNAEHIEELLPLVAIRFFLYRETADQHCLRAEKMLKEINLSSLFPILKNSSGKSITKKISSASLVDSVSPSPSFNITTSLINISSFNSIKEQLETIMYEFQEADANYTKAALYANADHCSRKAQLIAVQLYHLNKFKCNESMAGNFSVSIVINLDSNQVKDFINQCNNYFEAFIVSKSYPEVNIEWADPFFNNAIINNNNKYVIQFLEINEITVSFLEKLIKHFELFVTLFHQTNAKLQIWNNSNRDPNTSPYFSPSSPLQASFLAALMQIRSEVDLQKVYLSLEQIIETILCDNTKGIKISLIDKYRLAKKLNSTNLTKRLLESNHENYAYLLDLKFNKKL